LDIVIWVPTGIVSDAKRVALASIAPARLDGGEGSPARTLLVAGDNTTAAARIIAIAIAAILGLHEKSGRAALSLPCESGGRGWVAFARQRRYTERYITSNRIF
jgi:hypothetical protein